MPKGHKNQYLHKASYTELCDGVYRDAEVILHDLCPFADRNDPAFRERVFSMAIPSMVEIFVRMR